MSPVPRLQALEEMGHRVLLVVDEDCQHGYVSHWRDPRNPLFPLGSPL